MKQVFAKGNTGDRRALAPASSSDNASPFEAIAQRMVNAQLNFIGIVRERTSCTEAEAVKAFETLKKLRLIKLDAVGGRYTVKHGVYLEPDVLRNAMHD